MALRASKTKPKAKAHDGNEAAAWVGQVNSSNLQKVTETTALMKKTKVFKNAFDLPGLPIAEGGNQDPFSQVKLKASLFGKSSTDKSTYKCGGNLLWLNSLHSASPGVSWNAG